MWSTRDDPLFKLRTAELVASFYWLLNSSPKLNAGKNSYKDKGTNF